jgi:methylated-DNA-protein-cysteine methyltransferase-like protein
MKSKLTYQKIYEIVREIPEGKVATYGQIAQMAGKCTARMVGYAMSALPAGNDAPWHRVVNRQGKISMRSSGSEDDLQRRLLINEGIFFDISGKIDLAVYRWLGY